MKTMTWEEIDKDWISFRKQRRSELAIRITRYCIGHKTSEVAARLGFSDQWIRRQLDYAGISAATGGQGSQLGTPEAKSGDKGVDHAVSRLVKEFAPDVVVQLQGQSGNQTVSGVQGEDAEEFEPYLRHYLDQGHEASAAIRLAKSEWAAEAAIEAGVIKEDVNKKNEKVNRILFPEDSKDTFELDFKMHMARVESAARFLNEAKMNYLRRKSTCERVASVHEKWFEQVERVLNLQPTLEKD